MRDDAADSRFLAHLDFRELCREWRPRAAAYCRVFRGLSDQDREDVVGEALARAWAARDRFDPARPFAPWFLTIVRRAALDALARPGRRISPECVDDVPSPVPGAEEAAVRDSEAEFVRRFVAALDPRDRELASLVYGQDLCLADAARTTGIPVGTVKWRLHEIRIALRREWERENGER
ncbi:MAG TPA: sigma-70 family RNA polymerase sigma factor [Spirochaetia bacterium]|nr:sigma-70 family RNA polymerase sigma factor [Spirochaetales bacterium]HRY81022.1 sigma-70 family RNA polymerase sigma factor [Spirochaetia bacterium]HRZ89515.1 sigma-70 family RNA polymerase sigma factor [Spirochaetia bacterium]